MSLLERVKRALVRVKQALARLEDRLPEVAALVVVEPFSWRLSVEATRVGETLLSGRRWDAQVNVGPFGVAVSLELPRRKEEATDHA